MSTPLNPDDYDALLDAAAAAMVSDDPDEQELFGPIAEEIQRRACTHEESLYGRCTACGMTWEQQKGTP